jgi:tripartite-type tricarboxylate transporter receptor subunit TctC
MRLIKKWPPILLVGLMFTAALLCRTGSVWAADAYPNRPIDFIVTFAAGGSTDVIVRGMTQIAAKEIGQPFVVSNKGGGGGSVGTAYWASQKPDGYTMGIVSLGPMEIQPHLAKVPYDPIKDIVPIMQFGEYPQGLAVKVDSPFKTLRDLIEYARQNPGKVTYGTTGVGGAPHITTERVAIEAEVKLTHIPYKGGAPAITALLGGHVMATSVAEFVLQVKGGTARLLAAYNPQRLSDFPDVPTLKELGYHVTLSNYVGIGVPAGTPKDVIEKLQKAFKKACDDPSIKELMKKWAVEAIYEPGDELAKKIKVGYKDYGEVIKRLGLREEK